MKHIAVRSLALAALLAGVSFQAHAVVVDFNSLATVTTNPYLTVIRPYLEDGFRLTTISSMGGGGLLYTTTDKNANWTGSPGVYSGVVTNYGSSFQLDRVDGGTFDLISMDAAAFSSHGGYRQFNVYGYPSVGSYVHQYTYLDDTTTTLETITFNNAFSGLTKIVFSSVYAQVDNINLSVAPVPEADTYALILAGLGLVGIAVRRRRT